MSSFRLTIPLLLPLALGLAFLTGACGAPLAVTGASYAADGSLLATSNKTATDHLASMISKKDCALWRAFRGRPVCKEREGDKDPYNVDYNQPQRMVSEDGVQYAPPLRAAPDAPAASWDAAAYKAAPAPAAPAVPVTAVADATPDSAAAAPPPAAPKAKKPKVRSARKPLRDRAAPAF
ncbi:MAG: hypothetical protein ACXU9B_14545 [Reyranella sp.]